MKDFTKELKEALKLNEDSQLYQGIFWIVDTDNLENNKSYCFLIPSKSDGTVDSFELDLNAKSGTTYNHKKVWENLPSNLTHNKSFDYYPRGRVQINNGKAVIYLNHNIAYEEVIEFIKKEFNLTSHNGIKKVIPKADGSSHYRCHLD